MSLRGLIGQAQHPDQDGEFAIDRPVGRPLPLPAQRVDGRVRLTEAREASAAEGGVEVREPPLRLGKIPAPRRPIVVPEILRRLVVSDSIRARNPGA